METIYILTSKNNISKLKGRISGVRYIDEDSMLPNLSFNRVHDLLLKYAPERENRTGWYFQQFLKMGFARSTYCKSHYLSWDSDTLPLAPIKFFDGNHILYNPKPEYNPNYFVSLKRLLGIEKLSPNSFISESMMFSVSIMKDLLREIEKSDIDGEDWIEKIIASGDYSTPLPTFSEFETYGNFCLAKYPDVYKIRHLNCFREAGFIAGRNISERKLREMSFDIDMASFEMFHEPPFPHNIPHLYYRTKRKIRNVKKIILSKILRTGSEIQGKKRIMKNSQASLASVKYRLPDRKQK